MDESTQLIWSVLFGGIGIGYFSYGKKQKALVPLLAGIALLIFPYFITNTYSMIFTGLTLMALPYFIKQ
ncbi:MAG: hypothetical protein COB41_06150 [Proteobacteria bacterium]|nr:MAG: hypothetical protein COB41_06150 [Pseudomonadota bacterium]